MTRHFLCTLQLVPSAVMIKYIEQHQQQKHRTILQRHPSLQQCSTQKSQKLYTV